MPTSNWVGKEAVEKKLAKAETRYPVEKVKGTHKKYTGLQLRLWDGRERSCGGIALIFW